MRKPVLQVKWIKTSKSEPKIPDVNEIELEGKTAIVAATFSKTVRYVVFGGFGFIALDTVRQVLVAKANKV